MKLSELSSGKKLRLSDLNAGTIEQDRSTFQGSPLAKLLTSIAMSGMTQPLERAFEPDMLAGRTLLSAIEPLTRPSLERNIAGITGSASRPNAPQVIAQEAKRGLYGYKDPATEIIRNAIGVDPRALPIKEAPVGMAGFVGNPISQGLPALETLAQFQASGNITPVAKAIQGAAALAGAAYAGRLPRSKGLPAPEPVGPETAKRVGPEPTKYPSPETKPNIEDAKIVQPDFTTPSGSKPTIRLSKLYDKAGRVWLERAKNVVEKKVQGRVATVDQVMNILNREVTQDELQHKKVSEFLQENQTNGKIEKQKLVDYLGEISKSPDQPTEGVADMVGETFQKPDAGKPFSQEVLSLFEEAKKYKTPEDFIESKQLTEQSKAHTELLSISKNIPIENFGGEGVFQLPAGTKINAEAVKAWESKIQNGETPILITGGKGFPALIDGSNRLAAYRNLGYKEVPFVDESELTNLWNKANSLTNQLQGGAIGARRLSDVLKDKAGFARISGGNDYEGKEDLLRFALDAVSRGEAGKRIIQRDEDGYGVNVIGIRSTFPEWMRNRGLTKSQVETALRKAIAGLSLTEKQRAIVESAISGEIAEYSKMASFDFAGDEIPNLQISEQDSRAFLSKQLVEANRGRKLSEVEIQAQKWLLNNIREAKEEYFLITKGTYGVWNVVSADVAKFAIKGMKDIYSADYHEPSSALSKLMEKEILSMANPTKNILLMAGGSGVGKTSYLKKEVSTKDYQIIYDTNTSSLKKIEDKLKQAVRGGVQLEVLYVYRDIIEAFTGIKNSEGKYVGGVIPRMIVTDRGVSILIHLANHFGSLKAIKQGSEKFKNNNNIQFIYAANKEYYPSFDSLPIKEYTIDEAKALLLKGAEDALKRGDLNEEQYQSLVRGTEAQTGRAGSDRPEISGASDNGRDGVRSRPEQPLHENLQQQTTSQPKLSGGIGQPPVQPPKAPPSAASPAPKRNSLFQKLQADFENFYQHTVNRVASIENARNLALKRGASISPGDDPFLQSRLYAGSVEGATTFLTYRTYSIDKDGNRVITGESLRDVLDSYDKQSPTTNERKRELELIEYLKARRYLEDLAPRGIATAQQITKSNQTMARLMRDHKSLDLFEKTAKRLYDFQTRVLQSQVDSGLLSQKQYDAILKLNPNYVPFNRILKDEGFEGVPRNKGRFTRVKTPVEKIKGSELEEHNPLESIIRNTYVLLDRAARNNVARNVAKLSDVLPEMVRKVPKAPKKFGVTYKENGQTKHLEVSPNLYDALTGMNEQSASFFVKLMSLPATALRFGATSTPEFILRNLIRDSFVASIQTQFGFRPFIDSIGAMADILGKTDVYYEWLQSGGAYSGFVELNRSKLRKKYNEIRGKIDWRSVVWLPQHLSQLFEQATRVGMFKRAKKKGMSSSEAAYQSREGTLDFNRKGSSPTLQNANRMTAFLNASIQAFDKFNRTFKDDPVGATAKGIALITIPSLILYLHNRKDEDYKRLPRWQKDIFWMFKQKDKGIWGDYYVRIPKPFSYGQVFGSMPERFLEYLDGKDKQALEGITKALYDSLSPLPGEPVTAAIPQAIKLPLEWITNYNFFLQRNIVSPYKENLLPRDQYNQNTSMLSKQLGKALNLSPAKIDNLVRGTFGGSGSYALQGADELMRLYQMAKGQEPEKRPPIEISDIFGVKGFVSTSHRSGSAEPVQRFYDKKKLAAQAYGSYKKSLKSGDKEDALGIAKEYPDLYIKKPLEGYGNVMKALSDQIDAVIKSDMPENEKRQKIQEIERKKVLIAEKGVALDTRKPEDAAPINSQEKKKVRLSELLAS